MNVSNSRGFGFVEILVVVAILSIVALGIGGLTVQFSKQQQQSNTVIQADVFRRSLIALIVSNTSWDYTTKANASMACLYNGAPCATTTQQPFAIYDASNTVFYDPATKGINYSGQVCDGFALTGNDQCPLRYDLEWQPICPPLGSCLNPQVLINATLIYKPLNSRVVINTNSYSVPNMVRAPQ